MRTNRILVLLVGFLGGRPLKRVPVNGETRLLVLGGLEVLLYQFRRHANYVLTLPVLDQVQGLQRRDDIVLGYAGHHGQVFNGKGAPEKRNGILIIENTGSP